MLAAASNFCPGILCACSHLLAVPCTEFPCFCLPAFLVRSTAKLRVAGADGDGDEGEEGAGERC